MKKMSLCRSGLLLLWLVPCSLWAQVSRNGPQVGLGMGTQTIGKFLGWAGQPKLGVVAGWNFEIPVTGQVSLLLEPMYIGKGSVTVNNREKTRNSIALNYLEMPLMVKVSVSPEPQGVYLSGGIMYGYLLHGKQKDYKHGQLVREHAFTPVGSDNRSQWSAGFGLGMEKGHWLYELRAQGSLNLTSPVVRSHFVVYSVQVAWRFGDPDQW